MDNPKLFKFGTSKDEKYALYGTDITLRDLFAGMAMMGLLAHYGIHYSRRAQNNSINRDSYNVADAMLKEREVKNG